jgi:hypothetical protein
VYGYSASSTGQLTAIPGSPFKPAGAPIGGTTTRFFTMGETLIHSYGIASSGAIGSQISQIPVFDYAGGSCGAERAGSAEALLDHSGQYIYVLLQYNADWSCAAYQTYKINSDGAFTFQGDTEVNFGDQYGENNPSSVDLPITGLISTADVTAMYWDTSNHLYAISNADNTLHVFTVTATSAEEVPGSPYSIPNPVALTGHSM